MKPYSWLKRQLDLALPGLAMVRNSQLIGAEKRCRP